MLESERFPNIDVLVLTTTVTSLKRLLTMRQI